MELGVNIDHIATLRQLRRGLVPDLIAAARISESAGADSIVVHLREDRRHIQDDDVIRLRRSVRTRLNLEMSVAPDIVRFARAVRPDQATLVPEKRVELTTEGGLDVRRHAKRVGRTVEQLRSAGIRVSLFIEPSVAQVRAALDTEAPVVEFHTGRYADARSIRERRSRLCSIREAAAFARARGIIVNAGHGLDYVNVCPIAAIPGMNELNIGYAIVCHSVFVGLERAVRQMKDIVSKG